MKDVYTLKKTEDKCKYGEISKGTLIEKKSTFISYLFRIDDENSANECIEKVRKDNRQARHIVYIYSYLKDNVINIRFSDDGEPKGTGTKAIYELLTKENITNVCIVIVRYFGGILLGAGPLARAYLNTAKESIKTCQKEIIYNYIKYNVKITYRKYEVIKNLIDKKVKEGIIIINDIEYSDKIYIKVLIIDKYYNKIKSIFED